MTKKRVAIVGGGAAGCSLLWCLTSQDGPLSEVEATLFHDESVVGGHSHTINVWFDASGTGHVADASTTQPVYPVDIGVQFVCPTLYPNLYLQLKGDVFENAVPLKNHPALKISGAFQNDVNWGNFPEYQSGAQFANCYDPPTVQDAERFQRDIHQAPFKRFGGRPMIQMTVGEYLEAAGFSQQSKFFRYLLVPYLSIINGYGTTDLLLTTIEDLFPIFTKLPLIQEKGPYAAFTSPGKGWDRFERGAQQWVEVMATYATQRGSTVKTSTYVTAVTPQIGGKVKVTYKQRDPGGGPDVESSEIFDTVVLTTDMTTNRDLLGNPDNRLYPLQEPYIAAERFELIPGICYIHQDESVVSPTLREGLEDGQFCGYYAWGSSPTSPFGMPYDLTNAYQTYFMQNILGTPAPCYVSMYAIADHAKRPDPAKTIHVKTWRHGRWVASFFDDAKKKLHEIQGLGNVWFAGNNTTVDSEEGALLSAMIIAEKISSFRYPNPVISEAFFLYKYFKGTMFPRQTLASRIASDLTRALPSS